MSLSVNSPFFRSWYETMAAWNTAQARLPQRDRRAVPPVNLNDLGDLNLLTRKDLAADSYLTANVWNGQTGDAGDRADRRPRSVPRGAPRRRRAKGIREGAQYGDPYALARQLQVMRYSLESTSGNPRAQGWEAYRGDKFGPGRRSRWTRDCGPTSPATCGGCPCRRARGRGPQRPGAGRRPQRP
jgi:hypothetical protein